MHIRQTFAAFLTVAFAFATFSVAQASLPIHTYVSSIGSDTNDGTRPHPCATFLGAYIDTAVGGTISVIDKGDYGPLTIKHSITIDGASGQQGTIANAGSSGIYVQAGSSDTVILRHLAFYGDYYGVYADTGGNLYVEDCAFNGCTGAAVSSLALNVTVNNTIMHCGSGGYGVITTGVLSLHNDTITGGKAGVYSQAGQIDIGNSVITQCNTWGIIVQGGTVSCESCMISNNAIGVYVIQGGIARLSNCDIFNNLTGLSNAGGTISSAGNNKKAGNGTPGAPNGTVTVQ